MKTPTSSSNGIDSGLAELVSLCGTLGIRVTESSDAGHGTPRAWVRFETYYDLAELEAYLLEGIPEGLWPEGWVWHSPLGPPWLHRLAGRLRILRGRQLEYSLHLPPADVPWAVMRLRVVAR